MNDLEFYGKVNALKAGILYTDAVTTVSPRYSREIQTPEFGCGLDGLLRSRSGVLLRHPQRRRLPRLGSGHRPPHPAQIRSGGPLREEGLPRASGRRVRPGRAGPAVPVAGMVTRLAGQKGLDIVCDALDDLFGLGLTLVILGTGRRRRSRISCWRPRRRARPGSGSRSPSTSGSPTRSTPGATSSSSPRATSRAG